MKEESYKQFRCPGYKSNGERCNRWHFSYRGEIDVSVKCRNCKNTIVLQVKKIKKDTEKE